MTVIHTLSVIYIFSIFVPPLHQAIRITEIIDTWNSETFPE